MKQADMSTTGSAKLYGCATATRPPHGLSDGEVAPEVAAERPGRHSHGGPWERVSARTYGADEI